MLDSCLVLPCRTIGYGYQELCLDFSSSFFFGNQQNILFIFFQIAYKIFTLVKSTLGAAKILRVLTEEIE